MSVPLSNEEMADLVEIVTQGLVPMLPEGVGFTIMLTQVDPEQGLKVARATCLTPDALRMLLGFEMQTVDDMGDLVTIERRGN